LPAHHDIPLTWSRARLTPAAAGVFTEAFYPEPDADGAQWVWFAEADAAPSQKKVVIASRLKDTALRILTSRLAGVALGEVRAADPADAEALTRLASALRL
jgi:hypothetical protein